MKNRVALSLFLASATAVAHAQQINRITGREGESNRVEDATVLSGNGLALAGDVYYFNPSFISAATLSRTDPDGAPLWTLSVRVPGQVAQGFGVRQANVGDLLFAFHFGFSGQQLGVARVTMAGTPVWVRSYAGDNAFTNGAMELDFGISGEFGVIADRISVGGTPAGHLLRFNHLDGNPVSSRSYAPDGTTTVAVNFNDLDFVPDSNGDYFVTGAVTRLVAPDVFDTDMLVARIQRFSGGVIWAKAYSLPFIAESTKYEEGYSIEVVSPQTLSVVGRCDDPFQEFGPSGALNLRINPADGTLLDSTFLPDVQPANASLDPLGSGNLLASGNRTFGDGDSFAQMWEIDPTTATVLWRAEYSNGRTFGTDAVPHASIDGNFLALVGSNSPNTIPAFGFPDQMFIQTDAAGDDGCSAIIWTPERVEPELIVNPVTLTVASVTGSAALQTENYFSTLDTAIVCSGAACPGDLNDDGFVDDADFVLFAAAYDLLDCEDPSMPPGCPADLNGDGFVDDTDFVLFVAAYDQLLCP